MKGLYPKIMLVVGGVVAVTMIVSAVVVTALGARQLERQWLARAETLNRLAFEALYTSFLHAGDREANREVISRLQETGAFTRLWVVKGDPVTEQFGADPEGLPRDELDRRALDGEEVGEIQRIEGFRVVRYVTPLFVESDCQRCHAAPVGTVAGAISAEISLREYEVGLRRGRDTLLLGLGGGLLLLGLFTFYAMRRLVIRPLHTIQRGAAAIAQGDLDYRLEVRTGDELEALAAEFNRMAWRLQQSHDEIAGAQRKIMAAIEASQDAIWISDANRRVVLVNSALERLVGRRREELLGQTCRDLMGLRSHEGASVCEGACPFDVAGDGDDRVEGQIVDASGREIWGEIGYGRVIGPDGCLAQVVHILRDVTERKGIDLLKDEFLATASHELRTPLSHIKGFATTLLQTDVDWDEASRRDFLGSINHEADRLANLVEKILHLSRLEAARLPMAKEWHQAGDLVDGALQRWRNLTADRPLDICLSPGLPALSVDGREIETVLMNLIENSVKYSDPGTPIQLNVERRDDEVVFSVADQGRGIPAEHLDHIFERFYRVHNDDHRVAGSGLGLAICKRIVEAHDGHISVESTLGVGSRFEVHLRVIPAAERAREQ